ncbi:MAG: class I SAM-dependent methyltransferase [Silicimonas sp.]|nr:class I SAM-dependent methyltransferase [Silicimonas sp.]
MPADPTYPVLTDSLSDRIVALTGFQRTSQISRASRLAWEAGDQRPMMAEVETRRREIIEGVISEIRDEWRPIRDALKRAGKMPGHAADIGCGTAINDVFLWQDFRPHLTLIDIEETPEQYHMFADTGAGYASLAAARRLLEENGVPPGGITTINPVNEPGATDHIAPDLAISLLSCGFHYPIDDYLDLFLGTLDRGGAVVLDLRNKYRARGSAALDALFGAGTPDVIAEAGRHQRILLTRT